MPLPLVPLLGGLLRGALAAAGGGLRGAATGALGRGAMQGGVRGAASRVGLAGMVAASGKAIPAPAVGALAADFVTLGKALVGIPGKLRDFGDGLLEGMRHLSQYNGELAAAFAVLEAERMNRDIRKAGALAESGSRSARAQSKLEESLLPIETWWEEKVNRVTSSFKELGATMMEDINNSVVAELIGIKKTMDDLNKKTELPLNNLAMDIGSGKYSGRQRPPKAPLP